PPARAGAGGAGPRRTSSFKLQEIRSGRCRRRAGGLRQPRPHAPGAAGRARARGRARPRLRSRAPRPRRRRAQHHRSDRRREKFLPGAAAAGRCLPRSARRPGVRLQGARRRLCQQPRECSMKKRVLVLSIAAIVSAGAGVALYSSRPSAAQRPAAPVASITVEAISPEIHTFSRTVAATGTITARDELVIGSDASGVRLLEVLVDVGSPVRKGQLLARADDAQLRAQLAQQAAQVKQAQAENAQAIANLERAERLTDFFSVETVQTRRTSAATASARMDLAIAQLAELQVKVAQTRVLAPVDGVISRKSATVGAVVQPGNELFRLIREGELEWRAELPSHSIAQIRQGAIARIWLDNGDSLYSTVRMVAPTMDTSTRNGLVYVSLSSNPALRAGAYARGEILLQQAEALSVPENALVTRDGNSFVFALEDSTARLVHVVTGTRQGGRVEISDGLRPQDRLVGKG